MKRKILIKVINDAGKNSRNILGNQKWVKGFSTLKTITVMWRQHQRKL